MMKAVPVFLRQLKLAERRRMGLKPGRTVIGGRNRLKPVRSFLCCFQDKIGHDAETIGYFC
ncbi:MAG: hypothetical protein LBB90_08145, partial [Tannerella sp.]|nr:hypothetical protein [Tannerella sp.]